MPNGQLVFDERGIAVDGLLTHEGVQLDMRSNELVAVLVSRTAIAPDAAWDDDEAIRRNLMRALQMNRVNRWIRVSAPLLWLAIALGGLVDALSGRGHWWLVAGASLILVSYVWIWWADRRKMRRVPK